MTKREARKLAVKYYTRSLRNRDRLGKMPIEIQVKKQSELHRYCSRLHEVFDTIEYFHGREYTGKLYRYAQDKALGI